jgi:hypothetical protein
MVRGGTQLDPRQHKDIEPISKRNMRAAQAMARAYPRALSVRPYPIHPRHIAS